MGYINQRGPTGVNPSVYNYADDNTLSYSDTNINTVVKTLENDSINLIDWFSKT